MQKNIVFVSVSNCSAFQHHQVFQCHDSFLNFVPVQKNVKIENHKNQNLNENENRTAIFNSEDLVTGATTRHFTLCFKIDMLIQYAPNSIVPV